LTAAEPADASRPSRPNGRDQKTIARYVENVVIDFERLSPDLVKLPINQKPSSLGGIPEFANNVVLEEARIQIRPEPAPNPRGNSLGTQHGGK
jgi:hypothetical protein